MTRTVVKRLLLAIAAGGSAVALLATTTALAEPSHTSAGQAIDKVKIMSAGHAATIVLAHPPNTTLVVQLKVPAGKWALSAKLWGDSVPGSTNPNTVVRCGLQIGSKILDVSVFDSQRPATSSGTSAGALYLGAVTTLHSPRTVVLNCDDIYSNAQVHNAEMTAIGG
jgi:hypothetical protein